VGASASNEEGNAVPDIDDAVARIEVLDYFDLAQLERGILVRLYITAAYICGTVVQLSRTDHLLHAAASEALAEQLAVMRDHNLRREAELAVMTEDMEAENKALARARVKEAS
jgi:hypothetical protein